ncbi:hypothetical protein M5689_021526 [Euphorbia peplus]|nr:hypothetical protein M5689_021526 [Euphorbia peplus]
MLLIHYSSVSFCEKISCASRVCRVRHERQLLESHVPKQRVGRGFLSMHSLKMGGVSSDIMMEGCIQLEFRHYKPLHLDFGLIVSERPEARLKASS